MFLVRGSSSNPATVIRAIAKELGALHPRAIPRVAAAARTCNSSHLPLREYMESCIITPISSLSYPQPLVIDTLDDGCIAKCFSRNWSISHSRHMWRFCWSVDPVPIECSLLKVAHKKYQLPPVSQAVTEEYFEQMDWKIWRPCHVPYLI